MELTSNIQNEILFVGAVYKQPDLLVEYSQFVKSKLDFADEATQFFYDCALVIYETRSQIFNQSTVSTFMSENEERLARYKSYRGWNTLKDWQALGVPDNARRYFNVLKKHSLLREYQKFGFNVDKILSHPKFDTMTAEDVYRLIRGRVDRINTVVLLNEQAENMLEGNQDELDQRLKIPDMGEKMPFALQNDIFLGYKTSSIMAVGMMSNSGKSRHMMYQAAYLALVRKQKVLVLLNEMSTNQMRHCLMTTVVNCPEFQNLHGVSITKKERELVLGLYRDKNGNYITPKTDENSEKEEPFDEYLARVASVSEEYKNVKKVMAWLDSQTEGLLLVKDVSKAYDDQTLDFEIRNAVLTKGVKYWFFDTFKGDLSAQGDWAAIKVSATRLSQLCGELDVFGYISIQLTDDAVYLKPDELTSNNISECKKVKHVLDTFIMYKEIAQEEYHMYQYRAVDPDWGSMAPRPLDPNRRYYVGNVDKNRFGRKTKLLYDVNLDTNKWIEVGELTRK